MSFKMFNAWEMFNTEQTPFATFVIIVFHIVKTKLVPKKEKRQK